MINDGGGRPNLPHVTSDAVAVSVQLLVDNFRSKDERDAKLFELRDGPLNR
jgi:hypothetical protein